MSIAPIRTLRHRGGGAPYEQEFAYTGSIVAWVVPSTGIYQIELWGGSGGGGNGASGSNGSYAKSYHKLTKGQTYYLIVGGAGTSVNVWSDGEYAVAGGYNGGGSGYYHHSNAYDYFGKGSGGGASSFTKQNVVLPNVTTDDDILCVAGGGGGGSSGKHAGSNPEDWSYGASASASGNNVRGAGSGSTSYIFARGGGGGGYRGGNLGYAGTSKAENYGDYTKVTTTNANNGNGKAKITKM